GRRRGAAAGSARDRTLDGSLHRHAQLWRAGRISCGRPRAAARDRTQRGRASHSCGARAPLEGVCDFVSVAPARRRRGGREPDAAGRTAGMTLLKAAIKSPIGRLTMISKDDVLVSVTFEGEEASAERWLTRRFV